jgi:hypothetical protein
MLTYEEALKFVSTLGPVSVSQSADDCPRCGHAIGIITLDRLNPEAIEGVELPENDQSRSQISFLASYGICQNCNFVPRELSKEPRVVVDNVLTVHPGVDSKQIGD